MRSYTRLECIYFPLLDTKDRITFELLHFLLPPHKRIPHPQKKKKFWKFSTQDSLDSCIIKKANVEDLSLAYSDFKVREKTYQRDIHPIIGVVIPEKASSNCSYYVYYNDNQYEATSLIVAVDILFKLYHVFHLEYPAESFEVFAVFQNYIYEIECTTASSRVVSLISQLNNSK